ncbi:chaperonin 10-like protein [Coniochaeta sp. 2T2.1]|nr:chaperonin 10-like protein [Coniochaeta sp. 2T2.1]
MATPDMAAPLQTAKKQGKGKDAARDFTLAASPGVLERASPGEVAAANPNDGLSSSRGLPSPRCRLPLFLTGRQYNKPYELVNVEVSKIRKTEILLEVHAAGFCHSDLQVLQGQFGTELPIIPSHEPAGVVVKVGSAYQGPLKVGDRVGVLNFENALYSMCRLHDESRSPVL